MRNLRIILSLIFLLFLAFSWADAQNTPPRFDLFLEGGGSFIGGGSGQVTYACPANLLPCTPPGPTTLTSSFSKTARLFAGARFRFTRHDALETSYSFSPTHFSVQPAGVAGAATYNRLNLLSFNYVRYLWTKTPLQPFVTSGLGTNRFSGPTVFDLNNPDNRWQFAWNFGGGADIVLRRHFALRLELRDYQSGQPAQSLVTGASHDIVPSVGIIYRFK
jgi:opacity protein-like surface antigen